MAEQDPPHTELAQHHRTAQYPIKRLGIIGPSDRSIRSIESALADLGTRPSKSLLLTDVALNRRMLDDFDHVVIEFPATGPIVRVADFQSAEGLNVRFNGENAGKLFIQNYAMGAEFIGSGEKREDFAGGKLEMTTWLNAIRNDTDVVVKPEQAYTVTRVLEAIYQSAASGKLVEL